jgi:hypothetical protein
MPGGSAVLNKYPLYSVVKLRLQLTYRSGVVCHNQTSTSSAIGVQYFLVKMSTMDQEFLSNSYQDTGTEIFPGTVIKKSSGRSTAVAGINTNRANFCANLNQNPKPKKSLIPEEKKNFRIRKTTKNRFVLISDTKTYR